MIFQRHLCGIIGFLLIVFGIVFYSSGASNLVLAAGALRAGSLLMVTWLAWPTLIQWRDLVPRFALSALIILAVILVVRPSWGKIAGVVVAIAVVASFAGHWLRTWKQNR